MSSVAEREDLLEDVVISSDDGNQSPLSNDTDDNASSTSIEGDDDNNENDSETQLQIFPILHKHRRTTPVSPLLNQIKSFLSKKTRSHTAGRRRYQGHRLIKRCKQFLGCSVVMAVIYVMLYLPVFSNELSRQMPLPGWSYNTSRNVANYVFPDKNTSILVPRHVCHTDEKFFVLIVVCSSLENFSTRKAIRETWANTTEFNYNLFALMHAHLKGQYLEASRERLKLYSEFLHLNGNQSKIEESTIPVRVVFLVGRYKSDATGVDFINQQLNAESLQYQDIIQEDFIDTYNNLTLKSVMALKWVTQSCLHNCAYVVKCDDDIFVNVPNLLHFLLGGTIPLYNDTLDLHDLRSYKVMAASNRLNRTNNYLAGHLFCAVQPIADVSSKWYMPYFMYPEDVYPSYLSGTSYIMSTDVVPQLYEAALNTTLVYLEDVYITGMCAEKIGLQRLHLPLLNYQHMSGLCSLKGIITQHRIRDDKLLDTYAFVADVTKRCESPSKFFRKIPLRKSSECS